MIQDSTTRSIMTLYWWSHWFWITLFTYLLLFITIAHTYPSQEKTLEYNQNFRTPKAVTKLYHQSETTIKWSTISPISTQIMDLTHSKSSKEEEEEEEDLEEDFEDIHHGQEEEEKRKNRFQNVNEDNEGDYIDEEISRQFEYKRSAEIQDSPKNLDNPKEEEPKNETDGSAIQNWTNSTSRKPTITMSEDDDSPNDKTRTEDIPNIDDKNKLNENIISNISTNITERNTNVNTIATIQYRSSPSAPSDELIDAEPSAAEWLKTIVKQLPPSASQPSMDDVSMNMVTTSDGSQKIPFTLENVNREDELRRAENEHRTRKSKVLSAEYKHINRFINYSSDPKSLLTRSASSVSPNDFGNDSESNISSEALAIQRTYFLDAGSISAICITVFGVCCTVGTIGTVLYRRRYLNKPQTLSEPDSSVYIDDSTMRVSDNSDEMYSLDNDSFLNSLEAMTIQNYWTDTVKHTKL